MEEPIVLLVHADLAAHADVVTTGMVEKAPRQGRHRSFLVALL